MLLWLLRKFKFYPKDTDSEISERKFSITCVYTFLTCIVICFVLYAYTSLLNVTTIGFKEHSRKLSLLSVTDVIIMYD